MRHEHDHRHPQHRHEPDPARAQDAATRANPRAPGGEATVLLVGGHGGMADRYRAVVEEKGLVLRHYEKRVPPGARHTLGRVAAVVVIAGMVSHALRDQVRNLVPDDAPTVYLRTASVSALRAAVEQIDT